MHRLALSQPSMLQRVLAGALALAILALAAAPSQAARGGKQRGNSPTISGSPPTAVLAGQKYSFAPTATDPDNDRLSFRVSNQPAWATFDAATGRLSGTPASASIGTYSNIQIRVTDGRNWAALPAFSITVGALIASAPTATVTPPDTESPPATTTNRTPVILGTPVTSARAGQPYAFRPTATDADGDPLQFSIQGKPVWATFDYLDGTLSGIPGAADVSSASNVLITVNDGKSSATLPAFTVTVAPALTSSVRVSWQAPGSNVDGSPCTDLAGYRVFYGNVPGQYGQSLQLSSPDITSVVIEGLTSAMTWYFAVKAVTAGGVESDFSSEARKSL